MTFRKVADISMQTRAVYHKVNCLTNIKLKRAQFYSRQKQTMIMKKLITTLMIILMIFSLLHAQSVGTPNGNTAFFNTNAQGKLLGHKQAGTFGAFGANDIWTGIGQPISSAYGMRLQAKGNAGIFALTGTSSNKKLELIWSGPGKSANFEINQATSFTNPNGKTNRFTIKTNGKVGIGTTNPLYKLHVEGTMYAEWIKSKSRRYYFGDAQNLYGDNGSALYYKSNSSDYSQLIMRDKENAIYGALYGGGNGARFGLLDGDRNWSYLAEKDNYTAFLINNSTKMIIRSSGKVGIGTTNPYYKLDVNGSARVTHLYQSSDKRFKKDIKNIDNPLDKINALDGHTYKFKNEKIGEYDFSQVKQEKQLGFLAQDLKKVFPELVSADEDGYLSINYIGLIPVLVEGMKEQQEVITEQKEEIADLQTRMAKLEVLLNTSETIQGNLSIPTESVTEGVLLRQNAPNPFSNNTTIEYQLPERLASASLLISDLNGRTLATYTISGKGTVQFDAGGLDNGIYTYAIIANGQSIAAQKMVIQK